MEQGANETVGSVQQYLSILILVIFIIAMHFVFVKRSHKTKHIVIIVMLFIAFALHFLKPLYNSPSLYDGTYTLKKYFVYQISLESICAVSVVLFPFLYLFGCRFWKNGYIILGIFSGGILFLFPTEARFFHLEYERDGIYGILNMLRFYIQHAIIITAPILTLSYGMYQMKWKEVWQPGIYLLIVLAIICLNQVILNRIYPEEYLLIDPNTKEALKNQFQWEMPAEFGFMKFLMPEVIFKPNGHWIPIFYAIIPVMLLMSFIAAMITYFQKLPNYQYFIKFKLLVGNSVHKNYVKIFKKKGKQTKSKKQK